MLTQQQPVIVLGNFSLLLQTYGKIEQSEVRRVLQVSIQQTNFRTNNFK